MKLLGILLLFGLSVAVHAESCLDRALSLEKMRPEEAHKLCDGVIDVDQSIECARRAVEEGLIPARHTTQLAVLCNRVEDVERTFSCFKEAKKLSGFGGSKYAATLCHRVKNVDETIRCFNRIDEEVPRVDFRNTITLCQGVVDIGQTMQCIEDAREGVLIFAGDTDLSYLCNGVADAPKVVSCYRSINTLFAMKAHRASKRCGENAENLSWLLEAMAGYFSI